MKGFPSNEYRLIERLKRYCNYAVSGRYPLEIGDDAAVRVCRDREQLILTGDTVVEEVHFSFSYMTPEEVGYKAMVANISDCAAMGATPDGALVQVVFPKGLHPVTDTMEALYKGFGKACLQWDFPIVGGNVSAGPCWMIAITLWGRQVAGKRILTRKGARQGDSLWVTGKPGMSGAGLDVLKKFGREKAPGEFKPFIEKHISPYAFVDMGKKLADDPFVHAVIDVSDGIAKECLTLSYDNAAGIRISPDPASLDPGLEKIGSLFNKKPYEYFLYGGEDYLLLFSASEHFNPGRYPCQELFKIGTVTEPGNPVQFSIGPNLVIPVETRGWDHII